MHSLHRLEHLCDFYAFLLAEAVDFRTELFFVLLMNLKALNGLVLALSELLGVLLLELRQEGSELARAAVLLDLGHQSYVLFECGLVEFVLLISTALVVVILCIHFFN